MDGGFSGGDFGGCRGDWVVGVMCWLDVGGGGGGGGGEVMLMITDVVVGWLF